MVLPQVQEAQAGGQWLCTGNLGRYQTAPAVLASDAPRPQCTLGCHSHMSVQPMLTWGVMASFPIQRPSSALQATKKLDLWTSPEYLVLSLKRFSFNADGEVQSKLHSLVDYPLSGLDLVAVHAAAAGVLLSLLHGLARTDTRSHPYVCGMLSLRRPLHCCFNKRAADIVSSQWWSELYPDMLPSTAPTASRTCLWEACLTPVVAFVCNKLCLQRVLCTCAGDCTCVRSLCGHQAHCRTWRWPLQCLRVPTWQRRQSRCLTSYAKCHAAVSAAAMHHPMYFIVTTPEHHWTRGLAPSGRQRAPQEVGTTSTTAR